MSQKVTDGRDYLGELAPVFAGINDDVLFGQVWSREAELAQELLDKVIVICYIRMQQEKADFWSEAKYGFKKNQNNFGYRRNHRSRI